MNNRPNWQDDVDKGGEQATTDDTPSPNRPMPHEDIYNGWLGQAVKDLAPTTEADPVAMLATLASALSVMAGPKPRVHILDDRHPILIWPIIMGHTNIGRKGMSWGVTRPIIREADTDFYGECVTSGLSSGEGLISAVADGVEEEHPGGKRRLVIETEYGVTMARAGREGNSLGGILRQAWDGDNLNIMTKANVRATQPHVGIIAHVTPGEFRARVKSAEMAGGTYNRFLPIYSERLHEIPEGEGAEPGLTSSIAVALAGRAKFAQDVTKVGLKPEARDYWSEVIYGSLTSSSDRDGVVSQFTARAAAYCRRIAAVYALADHQVLVGLEHMRAAYALVNYSRSSAAFALDATTTGDPEVDKALAALMNAGEDGLMRSDFSAKVFKGHMKKVRLDDVLDRLSKVPGVFYVERRGAGRAADAWVYAAKEAKEAKEAVSPAETLCERSAKEVRKKVEDSEGGTFLRTSFAPPAKPESAGQGPSFASFASFAGSSPKEDVPLPPEPDDEYEV